MNTSALHPGPCETLVRTHDSDRFLLSLFYPPEIRENLCALYAFNYEIAKTREVVTDTHIGLIRLQWWRDALAKFYEKNEVLNHDVMIGLSRAIWRHNLPRPLFDHLIYAREFDLEDRQPGSLEGLCNYADYTHTPLLRLSVMIAGENPDHPALQPVAMAYALAGLLRAVPFHIQEGRCYLPEDLMRLAGVNFGTLQTGKGKDSLPPVIKSIRRKAEDLLRQADRTGEGRMIHLHRVMAAQYLKKIKDLKDDCYHPRLAIPPLSRGLSLWLAAKKSEK
jgi:NADH dehydrogenase [ubiquinone] 1 alpha subcomplex assembly factor 6